MTSRTILTLLILAATGPLVAAQDELPPVAEPQVCLECHGDMGDTFRARHVHSAFAAGKCSECHNPHASKHAGLLTSDSRQLCGRCHEDVIVSANQVIGHPPVANGECVLCHDPHASAESNQLQKPLVELCLDCHEDSSNWSARTVVHDPVRDGECMSCHASHGSRESGLLVDGVQALCLTCHDADATFTRAHAGRKITDADCTACHDPHASNQKGLLRANQHVPFAQNNCETCHDNLESGGSFAIIASSQETCLKCHRSVGNYQQATHRHNLDTDESCMHCHNPHASNDDNLLLRDQELLCMSCHFNDVADKTAYQTHVGVACVECHVAHGTNDPQLLRTRDSGLCAGCHEAAHRVSHPIGPEVIDPRSDEPVTCLSCHQLHGARFDQYLPLNPDMELCLQCHKR